jgi:hypothetical protein
MVRWSISLLVSLGLSASAFGAGVMPVPLSFVKPIGNQFVFVQLGDKAAEAKVSNGEKLPAFQKLRQCHPVPGLYTAGDDPKLVWEQPAGYVPYDHCFVTEDGKNLVLIEGDFWKSESFSGGRRPAADVIDQQFRGPAISFHCEGKLLKRYTVRELATTPDQFQHTPDHILWYASGVLMDEKKEFVLFTQESTKFRFAVSSGEIVEKSYVGLKNPMVEKILIVLAGLTAIILAAWGLFVYRSR